MPWGGPFNDDDIDILNACHVFPGSAPIEFPVPNPQAFRIYAPTGGQNISGDQSHSTRDNAVIIGSVSGGPYTINNAFVPANTNPTFNGDYTLNGIIYVEQPNRVTIGGSVAMNGVIIGEGDHENPDPINNTITIGGHTTNNGVDALTEGDPLFEGIQGAAQGISILAPGFKVDIGATFDSVDGGITANGISFTGNPQVIVGGPIINYSTDTMVVANSTRLSFDLSNYQGTLNDTAFLGDNNGGGSGGVSMAFVASEYREF